MPDQVQPTLGVGQIAIGFLDRAAAIPLDRLGRVGSEIVHQMQDRVLVRRASHGFLREIMQIRTPIATIQNENARARK
jgi:hypothetical protein